MVAGPCQKEAHMSASWYPCSSRSTRLRAIAVCLAVFSMLAMPRMASAQAGGSIAGTIKDSTGGVIPGATVTLTNTAIGTAFMAITDAQGVYSFPNVPVGRYDLAINLDGFKPVRRPGLAV